MSGKKGQAEIKHENKKSPNIRTYFNKYRFDCRAFQL